jgi:hypothetical protein
MVLPVGFKTLPRSGYASLRVIYPTTRDPNGIEFGKIRHTSQGWDVWGDTEEMGRALKAAVHRAGRQSPIDIVLAELRQAYLNFNHEGETAAPTPATTDFWKVIVGPSIDVTGDDLPDACQRYDLMLVETIRGGEAERDRYVYANSAMTIKLETLPYWSAATGQTHVLTISQKTH